MSVEYPGIDLQKINAEIAKLMAETAKFTAESEKYRQESEKFRRESDKLQKEAMKINRENFWYPMALACGVVGSVAAMTATLLKLISWLF